MVHVQQILKEYPELHGYWVPSRFTYWIQNRTPDNSRHNQSCPPYISLDKPGQCSHLGGCLFSGAGTDTGRT